MIQGHCLCGEIAWEAAGPLELVSHCHCSMCRKSHGSAFATYGAAAAEGFRWVRGEGAVAAFESSPGFRRPFCPRCGSVVAGEPQDGLRFMPLGCVEGDPGGRPVAHIFAASKAPWYTITDDLPRFDAYPPGFDAPAIANEDRDRDHHPEGADSEHVGGSCLCGDVRYRVERKALQGIVDCHCSRCRRARSAAHGSNAFAPLEAFEWRAGEDRLSHFRVPEAERFTNCFCSRCGSCMPRVDAEQRRVTVPAGSLDGDPGIREAVHIFYGSRAPWVEPADGLPRLEAGVGSARVRDGAGEEIP